MGRRTLCSRTRKEQAHTGQAAPGSLGITWEPGPLGSCTFLLPLPLQVLLSPGTSWEFSCGDPGARRG